MERGITDLKENIQKSAYARKPVAARRQANNNLLSFPYGDHFKKRERTREKPIKLRLSEARTPCALRLNPGLRQRDFIAEELNQVSLSGFDLVSNSLRGS
ncbi:hypothetical protein [Bradyrhizobium sp. dw_411]|uniref:hypothetical protein n=1 Tax=Bradyrhizobium sp. dw_411 TaxID=2720082 RepID=UPI001BCE7108|nr:hypothetical protein [Bradyrhizobium sp. dw_411]